MLFTYTAKSKTGEIFESILDGKDRFAVAREIKSRGFVPLSISEKKGDVFNLQQTFERFFSKVKVGEQVIFTRNLSGMLKAGLSLSRALSVLKKQTKNPKLEKILTSMGNDINAGETFSAALSKFPNVFSKLFI